jgi:hypothetical protein
MGILLMHWNSFWSSMTKKEGRFVSDISPVLIMNNDAEELVTYCGLYCGDCHGYTGSAADLAISISFITKRHKDKSSGKLHQQFH